MLLWSEGHSGEIFLDENLDTCYEPKQKHFTESPWCKWGNLKDVKAVVKITVRLLS